ncbi:MAG: primosomal protein N' [Clostridia bacterium]|nr:primosomal protein N' [Clostridia bacterium]
MTGVAFPRIVEVAVEKAAYHFDKPYSYFVPDGLGPVQRGCRVLIPFGGGNRRCQGIVIRCLDETDFRKLKPVFAILDEKPLFTEEMLDLAAWMKERVFCSFFEAAHGMLPPGLYMKIRPRYEAVHPRPDDAAETLSLPEKLILQLLDQADEGVFADKIVEKCGLDKDTPAFEQLVKKGLITRADAAVRLRGDATCRFVRPTLAGEELFAAMERQRCSEKQKQVLTLLAEVGSASVKELCYFSSVTTAVVSALQKKGLAEIYDREVLRSPAAEEALPPLASASLNEEQQIAYDGLVRCCDADEAQAALLYGVTGSGKTQVYMNLIDHVLQAGRQALVLVPEISLTPQMMDLFLRRYGRRVALLHSGLSIGERMDEWKRVRRGDAPIVLGTRSAVFAPLQNIGLIVMDEEQEHSYQSESAPRFHARDVAKKRCAAHKALLLLCSATPSVETYHHAVSGRYHYFKLSARYGAGQLPRVRLIDLREHPMDDGLLTEPLCQALTDCFSRGKQAILLYNRRGYHTFASCRSCGHVITCPACSISMTYHAANRQLVCHYCGRMQDPVSVCPECGSDKVRYSGFGTQRVEEVLHERFPQARILRMDADTTMSRFAYSENFAAFGRGDYDLMVGTQMVAKGLDFPNVELVGVLMADMALFGGDYRSYETTFSLLTQVVGRAGRRGGEGEAIIQTFVPQNAVIVEAAAQDYETFYEQEILSRRTMGYPPYTDLFVFGLSGLTEREVKQASQVLISLLKTLAESRYQDLKMIVLDPTPAAVARMSGKYRYKVLMKTVNSARLRNMIAAALAAYQKDPVSKHVGIYVDINPAAVL